MLKNLLVVSFKTVFSANRMHSDSEINFRHKLMAYHVLFIHFIIYLKTAFALMKVKKLVTAKHPSYMRVQQTEEDSAWM